MTNAREPLTWLQICELAECSPDFDVTFGMERRKAVYWLRARLISRSHDISAQEIGAAYDQVRSHG